MSNTGTPQTPREKRYGFALQSVFGTAEADAVAVTEVDCEPTEIDRDVKELIIDGAHGSRQQNAGDVIVHNRNAMPKLKVDMIMKKEEIAFWLYAMFQGVVEAATTPFKKTFTFVDQPDYQANAGVFFTWFERVSEAGKSVKAKDMVLKSMALTLTGDEPMKGSLEFVGSGVPSVTSTPSGTWTQNGVSNLFFRSDIDRFNITLTAGATNFHLNEMELQFNREVTGVGNDGAGGFQTLALTKPEHKIKLVVPKDVDWSNVISDHNLGTELDFQAGFGNVAPGTDDGDLDFAGHFKLDGPGGAIKSHDDLIYGQMTGRLLKSGATESMTVILADGVDRVW